jgi:transposase-like protein
LLARYHKGRLTQREFAHRHGVGLSTLVKWLQQERANGQTSVRFQEVMLPRTTGPWALEVVSPQGWTIRLARISEVAKVSPLLRGWPC